MFDVRHARELTQLQEHEERVKELEGVAEQQGCAIAELEDTLAAAAMESNAQQEEQEQLLRCLDAAGRRIAPSSVAVHVQLRSVLLTCHVTFRLQAKSAR